MSKIHNLLMTHEEYRSLTKWIRDTNPYCAICKGKTRPENRTVDHITPLSVLPSRAYDRSNMQILCKECHENKTRTRDNHFNNTMMLAFSTAMSMCESESFV